MMMGTETPVMARVGGELKDTLPTAVATEALSVTVSVMPAPFALTCRSTRSPEEREKKALLPLRTRRGSKLLKYRSVQLREHRFGIGRISR